MRQRSILIYLQSEDVCCSADCFRSVILLAFLCFWDLMTLYVMHYVFQCCKYIIWALRGVFVAAANDDLCKHKHKHTHADTPQGISRSGTMVKPARKKGLPPKNIPVVQAMFSLPQQIYTVVSDGPGFLLKLSPPIINSMAADTARHLHSSLTLQDCSQRLGGLVRGEVGGQHTG